MSDVRDLRSDVYKALNDARLADARAAVQAGLYINGLATTALLAFLASASGKAGGGQAAQATLPHAHLPHAFVWGLGFFGAGVFCAATTAALSYLANHAYADLSSPFRTLSPHDQARSELRAGACHALASVACFGSLAGFVGGVTAVVIGFDRVV